MSNPTVIEFAKEIGMAPLTLMDKIKEWGLPVKNHMAELEPEVLEQVKTKLAGPAVSDTADSKPKKVAARKAPAKKTAEVAGPTIVTSKTVKKEAEAKAAKKVEAEEAKAAAAAPAKSSVIRRKTKEVEPIVEERKEAAPVALRIHSIL